jgi:hypothetical protein
MNASYFITMLAGAAYPVTPANLNRIEPRASTITTAP